MTDAIFYVLTIGLGCAGAAIILLSYWLRQAHHDLRRVRAELPVVVDQQRLAHAEMALARCDFQERLLALRAMFGPHFRAQISVEDRTIKVEMAGQQLPGSSDQQQQYLG